MTLARRGERTEEQIASLVISSFSAEEIISGSDELPAADETVVIGVDGVEAVLGELGGNTEDVEVLGEVLDRGHTVVVLVNVGEVTIVDVVGGGEDVLLADLFEVVDE